MTKHEVLGIGDPYPAFHVEIASMFSRGTHAPLTFGRLRCDRAVPACGNCVNRGDITLCCYVARKPEIRPNPQDVSDSSQARIDHLEQLVHMLLKNTQSLQNQISSPSTSIDHDLHEDDEGDQGETTILAEPGTVINITSEFRERLSVNEAHWALLLNEVRSWSLGDLD